MRDTKISQSGEENLDETHLQAKFITNPNRIKEPILVRETVVSRRFMRGTDPIKSIWECPKLIS